MEFLRARRKRLRPAGALVLAAAALAVTACASGGGSGLAPGSAPGHWTQDEISKFTAAGGGGGDGSQDACIAGYFERDMSFGYAMAVTAVDPASNNSMTTDQIESAIVSKYGATVGAAINHQLDNVIDDATVNCAS